LPSDRAAIITRPLSSDQNGDPIMPQRTRLYFDGGCRPAGLSTAVMLRGVVHLATHPGPGASMDAEWLALIAAVRRAQAEGIADPVFLGDSRVVIGQAIGAAKARGGAVAYLDAFHVLTRGQPLRIRYIKRSQNLAGIALDRHHAGLAPPPRPGVPSS
jgi:ribonuclease HI